ncbi:MAG: transcription elongation factor GreA [Candidatus Manganitrophaceae bacterium]
MTPKGYEQLREELERLKRVERPKVIADIAEARAHGDLSENAEYAAAKERQSFIEGRIREVETKLADAQVIDTHNLSNEKVVFGVTVYLIDLKKKEERKYTIVGQDEADLKNGKISIHSPVGKALIGRRVGEEVTIVTPAKTVEYEILKITFE